MWTSSSWVQIQYFEKKGGGVYSSSSDVCHAVFIFNCFLIESARYHSVHDIKKKMHNHKYKYVNDLSSTNVIYSLCGLIHHYSLYLLTWGY